jgi:hypothetical protein
MNGISQQPAILRSTDQTEDELNTWSKIATGLSRRPPTQNVTAIAGLPVAGTYSLHHINRDINERYNVIMANGSIRVFDGITGAEKTVNAPRGFGYLNQTGDVYRAVTVADYTFIVNTLATVALKAVGADQVTQNVNNIWLGGTHPTEYPLPSAGYAQSGAALQYSPNPTYSGGITGTVSDATKLPATVCSACVYRVMGGQDTTYTPYYVMGDGTVWNETVAPGLINALDETTMPWALVREADGTFTFAPFSWKPRRVGDDQTNPQPLFVGRTIRDVFYYQNRLGFAVDNGVVFSAVGDLGDFYRRTVLDYLDSDTVAASAATTDVAVVDYALPFNDGVMLFSRQKQMSMTNADAGLSSRSLAIAPVTSYIMATAVRPTPMGSQAHFLSEARGYLAVQEYSRLVGGDPTEAADITAHVPHLIPKGASRIIPMHDLNALLILMNNSTDPTVVTKAYVYQFFWSGNQKLLSAWRVWDFGDGRPITGSYDSGILMMLMQRPDGEYLEKIDVTPNAVSPNQLNNIYLDRQVSVTGVYNAGTNLTTFALPYAPTRSSLRIVTGSDAPAQQSLLDPSSYTFPTSTSVAVPGDVTGHVTIGNNYTTSVTLTEQFPYMTEAYRLKPITSGRLQIHAWTLNLVNTAYLRAEVHPYGIEATALNPAFKAVTEFSPALLGSPTSLLGERTYYTGSWQFSAQGKSTKLRVDLVNDSPFEHTITSAQWEGLFFSRAM